MQQEVPFKQHRLFEATLSTYLTGIYQDGEEIKTLDSSVSFNLIINFSLLHFSHPLQVASLILNHAIQMLLKPANLQKCITLEKNLSPPAEGLLMIDFQKTK